MRTILGLLAFFVVLTLHGQIRIGDQLGASPSAEVEIKNTNKGVLLPRLTTNQRNNIALPAEGLIIYNLDSLCVELYNGTSWTNLCTMTSSLPQGTPTPNDAFGVLMGPENERPDTSAVFEIRSDSKGFVLPAMNTEMRDDIFKPAEGLLIFNNDSLCLEVFNGIGWKNLCTGFVTSPGSTGTFTQGGLAINQNAAAPDSSALLDLSGSNKGLLLPRLTESERDLIEFPSMGMIIYNTTTQCINFSTATSWVDLCNQSVSRFFVHNHYGGTNFDGLSDACRDEAGNIFMVGPSWSDDYDVGFHYGPGWDEADDVFVIKVSPTGEKEWARNMGGMFYDVPHSVTPDGQGGCYVSARTDSEDGDLYPDNLVSRIWIMHFDNAGQLVWDSLYGGTRSENGSLICRTFEGNLAVLVDSYSNDGHVPGNFGNQDLWFFVIDEAGDILINQHFGGSNFETARDLIQTADSGYLLLSYSRSSDRDVPENNGSYDTWFLKLDKSGNIEWSEIIGGSSDDIASDIIELETGGYLLSLESRSSDGDFSLNAGADDAYVFKLSSSGTIIWSERFAGSVNDYTSGIAVGSDGNYLIGMYSYSADLDFAESKSPGNDIFISKISPNGDRIWMKSFGGSESDYDPVIMATGPDMFTIAASTLSNDGDVHLQIYGPVPYDPQYWAEDFWLFYIDSAGLLLPYPTAENVSLDIISSTAIGESLAGSYDFVISDLIDEVESGSTYQWRTADDSIGSNATAAAGVGNQSQNYTVDASDAFKWLQFCVVPKTASYTGNTYCSDWVPAGFNFNGYDYGVVRSDYDSSIFWLDRNLGAQQIADSVDHEEAYGHLFQFGRYSEGHEERNSQLNETVASTWEPNQGNDWDGGFVASDYMSDWVNPSTWLWIWHDGNLNNPCPPNFRLPSNEELMNEANSWGSADIQGAVQSNLRIPAGGYRVYIWNPYGGYGYLSIGGEGAEASLHTYEQYIGPQSRNSDYLVITTGSAVILSNDRYIGRSVRCIRNFEGQEAE